MGKKSTVIFLLGLAVGVMLGVALSKKERRELLANYAKRIVKRASRHKTGNMMMSQGLEEQLTKSKDE